MTGTRRITAATSGAAVLGLLICALCIALVVQWVDSARLSDLVNRDRRTLSRLSVESSGAADAAEYDKLCSMLGGRSREVSWGRHMPFMINQLSGVLQSHGLKLEGMRPESVITSDGIARLPLRISFKTSLKDLAGVLKDMEVTVPILDIEQMSLRASDDGSSILQADMMISTFVVVDPDAPEAERSAAKAGMTAKPEGKSARAEQTADAGTKRGSL